MTEREMLVALSWNRVVARGDDKVLVALEKRGLARRTDTSVVRGEKGERRVEWRNTLEGCEAVRPGLVREEAA